MMFFKCLFLENSGSLVLPCQRATDVRHLRMKEERGDFAEKLRQDSQADGSQEFLRKRRNTWNAPTSIIKSRPYLLETYYR